MWRGSGGEPTWVDPFFACGILAAAGGGWLLAAPGALWWRVPAAVASIVALPLWTGVFLLDVVPRTPVYARPAIWGVALPPCVRVRDEEDWPPPGREPRALFLRSVWRHGTLEFGEARTLRYVASGLEHVDPDLFRLHASGVAPWIHVTWVLASLPDRFDHVWVGASASRRGGLDPEEWRHDESPCARVALPLERSAEIDGALTVEVVAWQEATGDPWRERREVPPDLEFRFGDRATQDPRDLVPLLRRAAGGRPFTGCVRANARAPFGYVMVAVSTLLEAGMDRWVTGGPLPPAPLDILDAPGLPYLR